MTSFKNLNLENVQIDESNVYIGIVFTLSDEEINATLEKKLEKRWVRFDKDFQKDNPSRKYYVAEDLEITNEEDPFYQKPYVFFTDLYSLPAISANKRKSLQFGFRLISNLEGEPKITFLNEETINILGNKNLNVGVSFDDVQPELEFLKTKLIELSDETNSQINKSDDNIDEIKDEHEHEDSYHFDNFEKQDNDLFENEDSEDSETEKSEENEESETQEDSAELDIKDNHSLEKTIEISKDNNETAKTEDLQSITTTLEDNSTNDGNDYTEQDVTDLEYLNYNLQEQLERLFPTPDLENDLNSQTDTSISYGATSRYKDLENVTNKKVQKIIEKSKEYLDSRRMTHINNLTRTLQNDLFVRHIENDKLYNYESPESELHGVYKELTNEYQTVIDKIPNEEDRIRQRNIENYKKAKEEYLERAGLEFDRLHKHEIEENTENEIQEIQESAEIALEKGIETLKTDIEDTRNTRFYTLVEKTLNSNTDMINETIQEFNSELQKTFNILMNDINKEFTSLQDNVKTLEQEYIQSKRDFDERVELEVNKRTQELQNLSLEHENLQKAITEKEKYLSEVETEKHSKEEQIKNYQLQVKSYESKLAFQEEQTKQLREELDKSYRKLFDVYDQQSNKEVNQLENFSSVIAPKNNVIDYTVGVGDDLATKVSEKGTFKKKNRFIATIATVVGLGLVGTTITVGTSLDSKQQEQATKIEQQQQQDKKLEDKQKALDEKEKSLKEKEQEEKVRKEKEDKKKQEEKAKKEKEDKKKQEEKKN
ncbi:coiled-coil domain-containing protein [Staphylococcus pseudoxylosus]|uniref:hypothetical protein n=1 Tax=Staphylococcus pseudoxylosus TaxID=2282419 RepID=UPI002DB767CA|nr:hypothetical protein [Staphylococcus pseudoxylosus]MEB6038037.1 hypothetical protein [Staphylococcus pseudoxylosus]